METPKKTGLGNSLLLRRTALPPFVPQAPPVVPTLNSTVIPESLPVPLPESETTPAPLMRASRKTRTKPLVLRDRCTLYIAREVNEKLQTAASVERRERSEIVSDILREHLPTYRIERQE